MSWSWLLGCVGVVAVGCHHSDPGSVEIDASAADASPGDAEASDAELDAPAMATICPAADAIAKQFVVYADALAAGWSTYGFNGPTLQESTLICTGTMAVRYVVGAQYGGLSFSTPNASAVPANHFSARIYVDHDSSFAVMAKPLKESDPHCYRLPYDNCGGSDPACGSNQVLAPCIQHWTAGWQDVELDIPASTGTVSAILFEQFSVGATEFVIDDVRLTAP